MKKLDSDDAINFLESFVNLQHALDKKRSLACKPCLTDNERVRLAEWDRRVMLLTENHEYMIKCIRETYCEEKS